MNIRALDTTKDRYIDSDVDVDVDVVEYFSWWKFSKMQLIRRYFGNSLLFTWNKSETTTSKKMS